MISRGRFHHRPDFIRRGGRLGQAGHRLEGKRLQAKTMGHVHQFMQMAMEAGEPGGLGFRLVAMDRAGIPTAIIDAEQGCRVQETFATSRAARSM